MAAKVASHRRGRDQPKKQQSESSDSSNHSVDEDLSSLRVQKQMAEVKLQSARLLSEREQFNENVQTAKKPEVVTQHDLISEVDSPPPHFVRESSEYFSEEEVIPASRKIQFTGQKQRHQTTSISESSDSYESPGSVEDEYIDEHQSSEPLIANGLSNDVATINLAPKVASHRRRHDQPKKKQNQTLTLPTCQQIKNQVSEDRTPNQTQIAYRTSNQAESVSGSASVTQSEDSKSRAVKRRYVKYVLEWSTTMSRE